MTTEILIDTQPATNATKRFTRLNIYPDGGGARLRIYGEPLCDWSAKSSETLYEMSALASGGRVAMVRAQRRGGRVV